MIREIKKFEDLREEDFIVVFLYDVRVRKGTVDYVNKIDGYITITDDAGEICTFKAYGSNVDSAPTLIYAHREVQPVPEGIGTVIQGTYIRYGSEVSERLMLTYAPEDGEPYWSSTDGTLRKSEDILDWKILLDAV